MISWIPEGHVAIQESFGQFNQVLTPGVYINIPFYHNIRYVSSWGHEANKQGYLIELSEQQTSTPTRQCQTSDKITLHANTSISWKIVDPQAAVYKVDSLPRMISDIALNTLRAKVGTMTLEDTFSSRTKINEDIKAELSTTMNQWGVELLRVEIQELNYSKDTTDAMMKKMIAQNEKAASITKAEGISIAENMRAEAKAKSMLIEAEAEAKALVMSAEADAKVLMLAAEARAKALALQSEAEKKYLSELKTEVGEKEASKILQANKYRDSIEAIAQSPSNKIFLPHEANMMLNIKA